MFSAKEVLARLGGQYLGGNRGRGSIRARFTCSSLEQVDGGSKKSCKQGLIIV